MASQRLDSLKKAVNALDISSVFLSNKILLYFLTGSRDLKDVRDKFECDAATVLQKYPSLDIKLENIGT